MNPESHALVLVNYGEATGQDILHLVRCIQDSVQERFGVQLRPEPVVILLGTPAVQRSRAMLYTVSDRPVEAPWYMPRDCPIHSCGE